MWSDDEFKDEHERSPLGGELWGDRPGAWAVSEQQQAPVYEQALRHVGVEAGDRVLDLGCGTGVFLRMCADRGALVAGLDASERLLAVARTRVPEADLRVADLHTARSAGRSCARPSCGRSPTGAAPTAATASSTSGAPRSPARDAFPLPG
jgi:SAM-dependent methyltransferase